MARLARVVIPGFPHHITQRGNRRQSTFFNDGASFVMDEPHLLAAARSIELNPVRAGIVVAPSNYPWSSVRAHLKGKDDALVKVAPPMTRAVPGKSNCRRTNAHITLEVVHAPLLPMAKDWRRLLTSAAKEEEIERFRWHKRTGRVLGDEDFQKRLEKILRPRPAAARAGSPTSRNPLVEQADEFSRHCPTRSTCCGDGGQAHAAKRR
ncbi:MAG: hypothetical protein ACYC6Y_29215 [Thermoguttaceae bacterium]